MARQIEDAGILSIRPIATACLSLTIGCALLLLAGCATPKPPASCIGLTGVSGVPVVDARGRTVIHYTYANDASRFSHLQCRVALGERRAIVELARAYETGQGFASDERRAASLYEQAAQDRPTVTSIYSPPVRIGGSGQMMMLPNPDGGPGDPEAKYRLGRMLMEGRGVTQDKTRGQDLIEAAIRQGFQAPAT